MNEFNWNKWSAVAEIISSIAILVTLGYLAVQTGQTNAMLEAQSRVSRSEFRIGPYEMMISSPELQKVLAKVRNGVDPYDLNPEERVVLQSLYQYIFVEVEYLWKDYQAGLITYDDLGVEGRKNLFQDSQFRKDVWDEGKGLYDPDYVKWADENLFEVGR